MKIQHHCRVDLDYRISGPDGETFDSSNESGALTYIHGQGEMPPKLEAALAGEEVGAEVELTLEPADAFGEYDPEGIISVPKDEIPESEQLAVGTVVPVTIEEEGGTTEDVEMRVVDIQPDAVFLDMNNLLAGKTVTFNVRVIAVEPTDG